MYNHGTITKAKPFTLLTGLQRLFWIPISPWMPFFLVQDLACAWWSHLLSLLQSGSSLVSPCLSDLWWVLVRYLKCVFLNIVTQSLFLPYILRQYSIRQWHCNQTSVSMCRHLPYCLLTGYQWVLSHVLSVDHSVYILAEPSCNLTNTWFPTTRIVGYCICFLSLFPLVHTKLACNNLFVFWG